MTSRLSQLRALMRNHGIDAYVVPSEDAHQSEYIANHDQRRQFISNFSGSAGFAVITSTQAALWTDGRYFLQAEQQLDPASWLLMKSGLPDVLSREEWLSTNLPPNSKIGIDPKLTSVSDARKLVSGVSGSQHLVVSIQENLIDKIWENQPPIPLNKVTILNQEYCGISSIDKISKLRSMFEKNKSYGFVVTALDEICWLFNLRGSDIPFNPEKLSHQVIQHLGDHVEIKPYNSIFSDLRVFSLDSKSKRLWIDSRCNLALQESLGGSNTVFESLRSPIMAMKAIKCETELNGFRNCHIRDASALCNFFGWLENELIVNKSSNISEVDAAEKLESFRSVLDDYVGLSFDTISGFGSNSAIIHYKPRKESSKLITTSEIYLLDSGAQFKDGTTDVTRTVHFGEPSIQEKDAYTRVLKGHIQLDLSVFPNGTTGYILDAIARAPLWRAGLDFRHGVGHGVGHFLNVHEGPHGIGLKIAYNDIPLKEGMTVTNEPGFYLDGKFGIRIENVLLIKKSNAPNNFGGVGYLAFEHVTVAPINTKLIEKNLLTNEEIEWVNSYNQECREKVAPLLEVGGLGLKWLEKETIPI